MQSQTAGGAFVVHELDGWIGISYQICVSYCHFCVTLLHLYVRIWGFCISRYVNALVIIIIIIAMLHRFVLLSF